MDEKKLAKYNADRTALKEKYPNARMTPYIDKMKGETWDSEQGKVSTEYGKIVDEFNESDKPTLQKDSSGRVTKASPEDFIKMFSPKKMAKGGKVKSASTRADGCAIRGKTRA